MKKITILFAAIMVLGFNGKAQQGQFFRCRIQNVANDKVLDADMAGGNAFSVNGTETHLFNQNEQVNQEWIVREVENGVYQLESFNNKVLDASGLQGARIQVWENISNPHQKWRLHMISAGIYAIECFENGLMLDADEHTINNQGCHVQLWSRNNGRNQQWRILPILHPDR
jgi:hypothetical protein